MSNSNQSLRQASVRGSTGTTLCYEGDWHALFTADGIAAGPFDQRMLAWINAKLVATHKGVTQAMAAYAASKSVASWNDLGTFTP